MQITQRQGVRSCAKTCRYLTYIKLANSEYGVERIWDPCYHPKASIPVDVLLGFPV